MSEPVGASGENWERQVLERLVRSVLDEQRRARKWSIFFKALGFIYLFALLFIGLGWIGGIEYEVTAGCKYRSNQIPDQRFVFRHQNHSTFRFQAHPRQ